MNDIQSQFTHSAVDKVFEILDENCLDQVDIGGAQVRRMAIEHSKCPTVLLRQLPVIFWNIL